MIDFRFRYQRPQQLASYFAKKGHRVFYLNISEFLPLDSENDFKVEVIKENVYEVFLKSASLNMYGGRIGWNALKTIYRSLDTLRKRLRLITAVAIVHNPFWTPLVLRMRKYHRWRVVYDCLDDWSIFDGLGYPVFAHELLLARKADFLAVTAELLHDKWKEYNADCVVVRNACDYDHFLKAAPNSLLSDVKRPVIGFFGGIANWIDIELIHFAATQRNDWSFVLLGDIYTDVSQLQGLPNVSLPGGKPYELMPDYLYDFDVCMIPFKKNKVTEAVDPVKLYEFFSLGKPVVARDLHEIRQYQDLIYLFNTREEFMACIEKALNEKDDEIRAKRRKVAAANTWEERVLGIDNKIREKYRKVSIIVVTYNNLEYNKLCMESILSKTDYPVYEIIVVDNNSSDGTPDYLRGKANGHPFIKLILNDENAGFARANNQGIKESTGNYIVLLNNDTIVTAGWLTKFVNYLDNHSDIGLIGPVTNFCGNEAKIEANYKDLEEIDAFAYQVSAKHEGAFFDIKMLALFCAAMRREIVEKVGSLDESFGVGMFEDDDYSHRVKLKGYRVVCAEDIFIHHFGQGAFKKLIETGEYDDIFTRNKALFEKKWGVPWEPHQFRKSDGIK